MTANRSRRRDARRHSAAEVVLLHGEVRVPEPTEYWSEATKAEWGEYWTSEVAKLTSSESLPALRRLFDDYDERRVLFDGICRSGARLTQGTRSSCGRTRCTGSSRRSTPRSASSRTGSG